MSSLRSVESGCFYMSKKKKNITSRNSNPADVRQSELHTFSNRFVYVQEKIPESTAKNY